MGNDKLTKEGTIGLLHISVKLCEVEKMEGWKIGRGQTSLPACHFETIGREIPPDRCLQPGIRVDALRPRRRVEMTYVYHLGKIKLPEKRPWLPSVAGESGRLHRAGP